MKNDLRCQENDKDLTKLSQGIHHIMQMHPEPEGP